MAGRRFPAGGVIKTSLAQYDTPVAFLCVYTTPPWPSYLYTTPLWLNTTALWPIRHICGFSISVFQYKTSAAFPCQFEGSLGPDASHFHMRQLDLKCPAVMNSNHSQLKKGNKLQGILNRLHFPKKTTRILSGICCGRGSITGDCTVYSPL